MDGQQTQGVAMHHSSRTVACALAFTALAVSEAHAQAPRPSFEPFAFEAADGTVVDAERGVIEVPENRADPASRRIELAFVRFPSTSPNPAAPIVYLAGGPGGSGIGTARGGRFALFMALREVADVIAFDQRGTGSSTRIPRCESDRRLPLDEPLTRDSLIELFRAKAAECAVFWRAAGVDLAGYNTWESAADLDALRVALGAERISLWGISYGTHLALATIKRYPQRIERAVLASVEGLDETVKRPARTDAYFARLQAAIDADPHAAAAYPDLARLMRAVHAGLDAEPLRLSVRTELGAEAEIAIGKVDLQLFVSGMIADPSSAVFVPVLYANIAAGKPDDVGEIGQYVYDRIRRGLAAAAGDGMSQAMDAASGISAGRLRLVQEEARTAILGDMLNFPMPHLADAWGVPDLGEEFRAPLRSDVPALFLSGTLDGRTYPESAAETAAGFANATHILIENAGHNLFMVAPEVTEVILAFMRGENPEPRPIRIPLPRFPH
jgi:pimeloyl-ACP methyl ester carboxylesterase